MGKHMNDLEIEFLEEYRALDILLKDVLSSDTGVTGYINKMSESYGQGMQADPDWASIFKRLKTVRHKRNILSHEDDNPGVVEDDIDFVCAFRERVLSHRDPLALLRKSKRKKRNNPRKDYVKKEPEKKGNPLFAVIILSVILVFFGFVVWIYRKTV